jgi:hypothetical protein
MRRQISAFLQPTSRISSLLIDVQSKFIQIVLRKIVELDYPVG